MRSGCLVMYWGDVRKCLLGHASLGWHEEAHEWTWWRGWAGDDEWESARGERENETEKSTCTVLDRFVCSIDGERG